MNFKPVGMLIAAFTASIGTDAIVLITSCAPIPTSCSKPPMNPSPPPLFCGAASTPRPVFRPTPVLTPVLVPPVLTPVSTTPGIGYRYLGIRKIVPSVGLVFFWNEPTSF